MKPLETSIASLLRPLRFVRPIYLANEAQPVAVTLFLPNQIVAPEAGVDHWVQLSPFGDFGNTTGKARVIQRFRKEDAETICNAFNGPVRRITQPLGMPFYIGHPDHPRFKGQPGHEDTRSYGRGKEMTVRHDAACAGCKAFANAKGDDDVAPCPQHGLFVKMDWNEDGKHLLANQSFHGHSVNWAAVPDSMENGVQVYRPIKVKSTGFTNEPNIPVKPASLANAAASDDEEQPAVAVVPPALKLIAGFKEDEDVTMDQVIEALKKARPVESANEAATEALGFFAWLKGELAKGYDNLPDCLRYAVNSLLEFQENQGKLKAVMGEALGNIKPTAPASEGIAAGLGLMLLANADAAMPADDDADKKSFMASLHELLGTDPASGKEGIKAALTDKVAKAGLVEKVKKAGDEAKKASDKHYQARTDLEAHLANERKGRAEAVVDGLVKAGKVVTKDRTAAIEQLCNAGDKFDETAAHLANGKIVVKTTSKTTGLANAHAKVVDGERERTAKLQQLMDARQKEFPNELYEDRFRVVANSSEGQQLFAQMKKSGVEE